MYKGYELKLAEQAFCREIENGVGLSASRMYSCQQAICEQILKETKVAISKLSPYGTKDVIDGNQVESNWFPKQRCHVFLSHSHKDEKLAMSLAGALKCLMNLDVFIDSQAWGFRDDLIARLMSQLYIPEEEKECRYRQVIAHVDCMLNKSLMEMEDGCECLLFLNTPNAVSTHGIVQRTESPWIYTELEASRFLRTQMDDRRRSIKLANETMDSAIAKARFAAISYEVPSHLIRLDGDALTRWCVSCYKEGRKTFDALDKLYI